MNAFTKPEYLPVKQKGKGSMLCVAVADASDIDLNSLSSCWVDLFIN
jgi:hypothetical protein